MNDALPVDVDIVATFYVVYNSPRDFRGQYVVRRQFVARDHPQPIAESRLWFEGLVGGTLNAARASLPAGLTRFPRNPEDDPTIVEAWMA